ncbi:hypothetical protein OHB01_17780 [Microbispora hainanensis]|jgi:hypothetical protein|uniref:Uncharacterized protein n=1 Tax=Microbispora hainanensis TaxID=568844 RepID=A0ABZ1SGH0_9ACTN|nr:MULTISPECIES: hypothetical protein [Microbispora]NJP25683.1 hypothetical protein [Microbispora sp. CL1-1]TQS13182.1 hypothetical protein FLW53_16060 [Microbispora sp. SCL1-1]
MRVYLPSTIPALARIVAAGELGPAPLTGFAVTPALIEWYASGDTEELEYVALTEAARASLRMLAADRADGAQTAARRVVIAAEVPDETVKTGADLEERARVRVLEPVPMRLVAAVHVDDADALPDVEAAIAALPAADGGDDDAQFVVDGAEDHELLWYATQEIPDLLT